MAHVPAGHRRAEHPLGPRHSLLLRKLAEALARGDEEISLEPADLEQMAAPEPLPLPGAFSVLLLAAWALQRPLEQVARTRWPACRYDAQVLLVWGTVALGCATMLTFLLLVLQRI